MTTSTPKKGISERNAFILVFLISFSLLTLFFAWLVYGQFAQVFTREGKCTVVSAHTAQDPVDLDNPTTGGALYSVSFKVSLLTADGQRLQVPGYYRSSNFNASDAHSIALIMQSYPVGHTTACGYTFLDPSGIKAIFAPSTPLEGFLFPAALCGVFLVLTIICFVALRRGTPPEVPFPDELEESKSSVAL